MSAASLKTGRPADRRFIGVRFRCCGAYARVYLNKSGTAYEGRCPHCLRPVRALVGENGTACRFFEAI